MPQLAHLGRMMSPGRTGVAVPWVPTDLGASLLAWWPADPDQITESGGLVSSWVDVVASYNCTASLGERPTYSATGWNGGEPGLTFDGTANFMTLASQPFPSAGNSASIWAIVDQTALVADTGTRCIASYGGDSAATQRRLLRRVVTGANVLSSGVNTGTADAPGDFSGRHTCRGATFSTGTQAGMDGSSSGTASTTPGTGTNRFRIGAIANPTAANFFQGVIRHVLVTGSLTAGQAASLYAWGAGQL